MYCDNKGLTLLADFLSGDAYKNVMFLSVEYFARYTGNGANPYHPIAKPLKLCINGPDICKKPLTGRGKCAILDGYKAVTKTCPGG